MAVLPDIFLWVSVLVLVGRVSLCCNWVRWQLICKFCLCDEITQHCPGVHVPELHIAGRRYDIVVVVVAGRRYDTVVVVVVAGRRNDTVVVCWSPV